MAVGVIPLSFKTMAQEEQRYSNSSSGGGGGEGGAGIGTAVRSCKKLKQKKIPQRGLGVAQLERIRLEELQKKDAAAAAAAVAASSCFVVPLSHHPPSLADLPPPNSVFKTSVPISTHDLFNPPPVPPFACEGGTSGGQRAFALQWNGLDFNQDAEKAARELDHHNFQFQPHLHNELHPLWQSPTALQRNREQRQQQRQQSPFLVNKLLPFGFFLLL